jgi:Bacterial archaeo-eukaryotic release factor family 10
MEAATGLITNRKVEQVIRREDLLALATLCDPHATAVSFGFGHITVPDDSHREEVIAIKGLIQHAIAQFAPEPAPLALSKDLDQILTVAEEIRRNPARLRLVFACSDQGFWREFDLPSTGPLSFLHLGRRFYLAQLMLALQSLAPYCVAIIESGKARVFVVRGTEIQEVTEGLAIEELRLPADDPRVGWSKHVLKGRTEHEREYFKNLSHQLLQLVSKEHAVGLVIGCHEDLWGEVEPQFAHLENAMMGRFHLAHFDAEPSQLLRMAMPVFEDGQRTRVSAVLREINETPSRRALGVKDVLEALSGGRVQKLILGGLPGQMISECKSCGSMMAAAGHNCASCGNAEVFYMPAEEGLIRQALLTDAEVLFAETDAVPGFNGAAAWLRY